MDGGEMMTGNAGTVAIIAGSAQPAHCLIARGHFSTKDWNVRGITHKMLPVLFFKRQMTVFITELPVESNIYCRSAVGLLVETTV